MLTSEFVSDVVKRASLRQPKGGQRCRAVLRLLGVSDAVRDQLRLTLAEYGCTGAGVRSADDIARRRRAAAAAVRDRGAHAMIRRTLTDVPSHLEAAGLVLRRRNESDRRQLLAELTPRGWARCNQVVDSYVDAILENAADLSTSSLSKLGSTHDEMAAAMAT